MPHPCRSFSGARVGSQEPQSDNRSDTRTCYPGAKPKDRPWKFMRSVREGAAAFRLLTMAAVAFCALGNITQFHHPQRLAIWQIVISRREQRMVAQDEILGMLLFFKIRKSTRQSRVQIPIALRHLPHNLFIVRMGRFSSTWLSDGPYNSDEIWMAILPGDICRICTLG